MRRVIYFLFMQHIAATTVFYFPIVSTEYGVDINIL